MHEYRVLDVRGDTPSVLEHRLNHAVVDGWLVDRLTSDAEGQPRLLILMRVRVPAREAEPS